MLKENHLEQDTSVILTNQQTKQKQDTGLVSFGNQANQ